MPLKLHSFRHMSRLRCDFFKSPRLPFTAVKREAAQKIEIERESLGAFTLEEEAKKIINVAEKS